MPTVLAGRGETSVRGPATWAGRVQDRLIEAADEQTVRAQQEHIRQYLKQHGVTFEGKRIDVSFMPTIVSADEVARVSAQGRLIRSALEKVIAAFRRELRRNPCEGPLQRAFRPYRKWFGLITRERPLADEIGLMRFDCIRPRPGRWTFIETNTACAGGTTTCPILRRAWLTSPLGKHALRGARLKQHPQDRQEAFVEFLLRRARQVGGPGAGNVAALNHCGDLTFEMDLWEHVAHRLRKRGQTQGKLLLGDIREVEVRKGAAYLRGVPIALFHNKVDPLGIDPEDPSIQDWIAASRLSSADFLNSFGAKFLTEAKRVLVLLQQPEMQDAIGLDPAERQAAAEMLPPCAIVRASDAEQRARLHRHRRRLVLKADALTRGKGVFMGNELDPRGWDEAIDVTHKNFGVVQQRIPIPLSPAIDFRRGHIGLGQEHYGIELFYLGGRFGGIASRSHRNQVFNVGVGGKERAALAVARWMED
ncbi:MAG TPA: hypothetical protein VLV83_03710 [Acidobacteriota bacterium]|nr:hypothetical protein [Acidobacteriota bacterium]